MYILSREQKVYNRYGPFVFFYIFLFIIISGTIFYNLLPDTKISSNILFSTQKCSNVYILVSDETLKFLQDTGYNKDSYLDRLSKFKRRLEKIGVKYDVIRESNVDSLPATSTILALDIFALSKESSGAILNFLKRGGNLLFNYHFAYFQNKKIYQGSKLIEAITGLRYIKNVKNKKGLFFIPKILSPIMLSNEDAKRFDLILYDSIPLFESKENTPDAVLTNWAVTSTPMFDNKKVPMKQAGIVWHGLYGKGSWIYFSFPLYSFLDMPLNEFELLMKNITNYLNEPVSLAKYPYLDTKKAIFISEDTEYKYENLKRYATLAQKYGIDTTLFCVANLAEQYSDITKEVAAFSHIEIGSHSYSHTKISGENEKKVEKEIAYSKKVLEDITGEKVYGFRPPREEIDEKMIYWLRESGYLYTMERSKDYLLPKEEIPGLITLPRHGTDDYIYLINLDWDKDAILNQIIYETELLTSFNVLYTLSIHTHLLSYKNNINIVEKFFKYLQTRKDIKPLKGRDLAIRARQLKNIDLFYKKNLKNIFVNIENRNDTSVKNFTFRLYWHNLKKIGKISSEILNIKVEEIKRDKKEKFSDIRVKELKPNSVITLIIPYE